MPDPRDSQIAQLTIALEWERRQHQATKEALADIWSQANMLEAEVKGLRQAMAVATPVPPIFY